MNDTNTTMCERCEADEATVLVEHALYGEAICKGCRDDEAERAGRIEDDMRFMDDDYDRWCQRGE